ncbi:MAG: signal peptidase II [Ignavibacteriales bacterium]|nr:signal peptidase II [Ignavibacteriales bacterium]
MRVLYVTGIIVLLDQITKLLVKGFTLSFLDFYHPGMQLGASIPILGDFLRLTFIENPGMAFGIDIGGRLFLTVFSIIASVGILFYLYRIREETLAVRVPLAMILGGAIGNLIDRVFYGVIFGEGSLFYGKVVDFFDVDFFNIDFVGFHISRWPVFNVADASVSLGVLVLLMFHRKFTSVEEPRVSLAASSKTGSSDGMKNGSSETATDGSTPTPS